MPAIEQTLKGILVQINDWAPNALYQLVLRYGEEFHGATLPAGVEYGEMQECYANTLQVCRSHPEYTYCEGYALRPELGLNIAHAWALTPDGTVVDTTWRDTEDCSYIGIRFSLDFVKCHLVQAGYYGLLANHWLIDGCPLFTADPVFDDEGRICDYGED